MGFLLIRNDPVCIDRHVVTVSGRQARQTYSPSYMILSYIKNIIHLLYLFSIFLQSMYI